MRAFLRSKRSVVAIMAVWSVLCVILLGKTVAHAEDTEPNYLTFTAEEDSTITFSWGAGSDIQISMDGGNVWSDYTAGTVIYLDKGNSVSFKGNDVCTWEGNNFSMTGKIAASGDVTSLTNGVGGDCELNEVSCAFMFSDCSSLMTAPQLPATTMAWECYYKMFSGCSSLTTAPDLPATTLSESCYMYMFEGCTSLTTAPNLPATTLSERCYMYMFEGCTSLTTAPKLPATTMAWDCYYGMFSDCTSLTTAPDLSATQLASDCYSWMFSGCSSLTTAPNLPATTLSESCYEYMFLECSSLATAPNLPATELALECYSWMFSGCSSLTTAPNLPATELALDCYSWMFSGCSSLTTAPVLSATELAESCYMYMFEGCTSLTTAPVLPATELAKSCYYGMFSGCSSLTTAPKLPATTLEEKCYYEMFSNCSSLTTAPELPATELAESCYDEMFAGCSSLTTAPELPATTLAVSCYKRMFKNCTGLTTVPKLKAKTVCKDCYTDMFSGCKNIYMMKTDSTDGWYYPAHTGGEASFYENNMFDFSGVTNADAFDGNNYPEDGAYYVFHTHTYSEDYVYDGNYHWHRLTCGHTNVIIGEETHKWNEGESIESSAADSNGVMKYTCVVCSATKQMKPNYLTFTAQEDSTISFSWNNGENVQISTDGGNVWNDYTAGTVINLEEGKSVSFKGNNVATDYDNHFTMTGKIIASGDVTSLTNGIGGDCALNESCYCRMFYECSSLTTAPKLPATTLAEYCYAFMFYGCSSLEKAPDLPATTLAENCYEVMFYGCSSLATAPDLPATTLAENCYESMFSWCSSLTTAPKLPATTLAEYCYFGMFSECANLLTASELPATILAKYCYAQMFFGCSSLTTAPNLPATTLTEGCYMYMFYRCSSLTTVPELKAETVCNDCYLNMFTHCSNIYMKETTNTNAWYYPIHTGAEASDYESNMFAGTGATDENAFGGNYQYPTDGKYYVFCSVNDEEENDNTPKHAGSNISLKGNIVYNYYMSLPDDFAESSTDYLQFTGNGISKKCTEGTKVTVNGRELYMYSLELSADKMTEEILVTYVADGITYMTDSFTLADYANIILKNESNNTEYAAAHDLVAAMLNYGAYAQEYFGVNTDNLANAGLWVGNDPVSDSDAFAQKINGESGLSAISSNSILTYSGSSLVCEDTTDMKFYFKIDSSSASDRSADSYAVTCDEGSTVSCDVTGDFLVVTVEDIYANMLDAETSVTITGANNMSAVTFTARPMDYIITAGSSGTNSKLQNLARAMYYYNQAAADYIEA